MCRHGHYCDRSSGKSWRQNTWPRQQARRRLLRVEGSVVPQAFVELSRSIWRARQATEIARSWQDAPHASSTRRATPCWRSSIAFSTALNCKPNVARHEIIPRQHRPEPSPNGFLSNADSHRHPSSRRSIEIKMLPLFSQNGPKQGGAFARTQRCGPGPGADVASCVSTPLPQALTNLDARRLYVDLPRSSILHLVGWKLRENPVRR